MYPRRKGSPSDEGPNLGCVLPCAFGEDYPTLWAFLTEVEYDDGSTREPGTVLVCVGEGRARLWLHDKDEGCSAWVSASSISDALASAERGLHNNSLEWRADRKGKR